MTYKILERNNLLQEKEKMVKILNRIDNLLFKDNKDKKRGRSIQLKYTEIKLLIYEYADKQYSYFPSNIGEIEEYDNMHQDDSVRDYYYKSKSFMLKF